MTRARRVGLIFGGRSVEHEVSVDSARIVARAIRDSGMECLPLAVTGAGHWLGPEASRLILESDAPRVETPDGDPPARLAPDFGAGGLVSLLPGEPPRRFEVDVVFPLIHGWGGEDGRLQGALDLAGVPYVGAGATGSAIAMDKIVSKHLFMAEGLAVVDGFGVRRAEWARESEQIRARIAERLGYPVFVKPANGGSSVGVSKAGDADALEAAFAEAFACDPRALVERGVPAREIECAVVGNEDPRASVPGEIEPSGEFYDYRAKYVDGRSKLVIPAELEANTAERVRSDAVSAFRALDLRGLARVDFLLDRRDGALYLNEVNTLPGFTSISMFPRLWDASGLPLPRLVERLIELALECWQSERGLRTRHGAA